MDANRRTSRPSMRIQGPGWSLWCFMMLESGSSWTPTSKWPSTFHRATTGQAASHLALVDDNAFLSPRTAAKLLSTDPGIARAAAREFARHLDSTRPANRTLFETHIIESQNLWQDLVAFGESEPPVLLWKGHGACPEPLQIPGASVPLSS